MSRTLSSAQQFEKDRSPTWYDLYQVPDKNFQFQCSVVFELLGTFFFVYGIITADGDNYVQAVCMGTMIWFAFQHSGAQYNPGVTLNMTLRGRMDWQECLVLTITQVIAVILAALTARGVYGKTAYPQVNFDMTQSDSIQYSQAFFQELFGTFMLVTLINIQTTQECTFTEQKGLVGVLFIFVFFTARIYTGSSGGVINPAIGFGLPLMAYAFRNDYVPPACVYGSQDNIPQCQAQFLEYQGLNQCWVWIVSSYFGAVLAFVFFQYLYYPTVLRVKNKI